MPSKHEMLVHHAGPFDADDGQHWRYIVPRVFRDISGGARYACRLIIMLMSPLEDHLFSMGPRGH